VDAVQSYDNDLLNRLEKKVRVAKAHAADNRKKGAI
jgi:hypothetical protein